MGGTHRGLRLWRREVGVHAHPKHWELIDNGNKRVQLTDGNKRVQSHTYTHKH